MKNGFFLKKNKTTEILKQIQNNEKPIYEENENKKINKIGLKKGFLK